VYLLCERYDGSNLVADRAITPSRLKQVSRQRGPGLPALKLGCRAEGTNSGEKEQEKEKISHGKSQKYVCWMELN